MKITGSKILDLISEIEKENMIIKEVVDEDNVRIIHAHRVVNWLGDCRCSNCGEYIDYTSNYCNRCGAKLDEPDER